ncbi:MAG: uroporphyrinogen-III C-methyltransferase [Phycisphaerae bacterium]|nr:uroporphyrinogen-III C-methyltransferase [Phycisphaerae bacterium]
MSRAKVYLVGAGPGDPSLLTLRALELIARADCIVYDGLVAPEILRYARPDAELVSVRKRTGDSPVKQQDIHQILLDRISQGKMIVRLKGGDPGLFGRSAEEVALCIEQNVPFEIIPGITSALAAADYCGIFLTDRESSSQLMFVTGQKAAGKIDSRLDFANMAAFGGTIVFYMAMTRLDLITAEFIRNGKNPKTPVAVIQNASTPRQRLLLSNLKNVAGDCRREGIEAPAIVILGPTAHTDARRNWFMARPLFGKRIVITRDRKGNEDFAMGLLDQGAEAVVFDTIRIVDQTQDANVQPVLSNLSAFDWIFFTSANGVRHVFSALSQMGRDARALAGPKIACIGSESARCLSEYGIRADFVPTKFTGKAMVEELAKQESLAGKKIVLLRSGIALDDLPRALTQLGSVVTDCPVYTVQSLRNDPTDLLSKLSGNRIDWITFTSSSTVRSFFEQIPLDRVAASKVRIASIGPETTRQLKDLGVRVDLEAERHTIEGLVEALKGFTE